LIDAAAALEYLTGEPVVESLGLAYRYNKRVFLAPPWPEIYTFDQERRHGFTEAVAEYNRLIDVYPSLGYNIQVLPKMGVAERANWMWEPWRADSSVGRAADFKIGSFFPWVDHVIVLTELIASRGGRRPVAGWRSTWRLTPDIGV
jgi:hypothetical protein